MKRVSLKNRLFLSVLFICTVITLGVSLYQLSGLQRQEMELAQREIDNFEQSALTSLREALWNYDWNMVEIIVNSQLNPVLSYIKVCDADEANCIVADKTIVDRGNIEQDLSLTYRFSKQAPQMGIGSVTLKANYKPFSMLLDDNLMIVILTNSLWVFGVAISVFVLFHLTAIRRLEQVEKYTRNIDLADVESLKPLTYGVDKRTQDEVDLLALAVTDLVERIREEFDQRRQLENRLNQTQKMEALGTLAGGIAHDFNNILAAILGYSQLCLNNAEPGSSMHKRLEQVVSAGQRAKSLVSQILVFSRKVEDFPDKFCLAAVVVEALDLVRASLPDNVALDLDVDDSLWIAGDDNQLHQVVMNLATNAIYSLAEKGGDLRVKVRPADLDMERCRVLGLAEAPYIEMRFCDDGPGIPDEIKDRIFEPFFTTKKTDEGTGMGLAVVHGIVQSHGGRILLDNDCDKGCCFVLYFPRVEGLCSLEDDLEDQLYRGDEHLVLVDDEEIILKLGRDMLESLGYRISTFTEPLVALDFFKQDDSVAVLITDLTMPAMNGVELAKEIKRERPVPIVLWSGYADLKGHKSLEDGTIDHVLHKPFTIEGLSQVIHKTLRDD